MSRPDEHILAFVFGSWVQRLLCHEEPRTFDRRSAGARVRLDAVEAGAAMLH